MKHPRLSIDHRGAIVEKGCGFLQKVITYTFRFSGEISDEFIFLIFDK